MTEKNQKLVDLTEECLDSLSYMKLGFVSLEMAREQIAKGSGDTENLVERLEALINSAYWNIEVTMDEVEMKLINMREGLV